MLKDGKYTTNSYQHYQFLHLNEYFDLELVAMVGEEESPTEKFSEPIDSSRLKIIPLPYADGWFNRYIRKFPVVVYSILQLFCKKKKEWDLILIVDPDGYSQIAYWLSRCCGIPAVVYIGGSYNFFDIWRDIVFRRKSLFWKPLAIGWAFFLSLSEKILLYFAPSIVTGRELHNQYSYKGKDILLYNSTLIQEKDINSKGVEQKKNIPYQLKLLCVCRLVPVKGLEYLVDAFKELPEDAKITVDIIGSGTSYYEDFLMRKIKDYKLESKIRLLGSLPHDAPLMKRYEQADAFVLPSISEGTPKVLFEAMAKGLPLIVTAVGGIPYLVAEKECALLVPPREPHALARAMLTLAENMEMRIKMGGKAIEAAREFTLERQIAKLSEFLLLYARKNTGIK
ncbi:MAG: glycosyltransferase family 4 protein [Firmicutes bacterium]|nr:glycosyltransferase family 4 protein [Bacillota bacterium]